MSLATAVTLSVLLLVAGMINPYATNWIGFGLFYTSLFLSLVGLSAILGFVVRFIALKQHLAFRLVRDAFRQSFLLAFLAVCSLFLMSKGLFTWMNIIFLVVALAALEFFLITYEKKI